MAEPQHIQTIVPEHEDSAGYVSAGYGTSTASLSSSICEYVYENGRRYHAYFGPDKNLQPTDELEQDRLDLHHEIFLLLLDNQLHNAPIGDTPHRILDVGTGTGIWAVEMADKYPSAEVIGTDLSPIQPSWVPPNCRFEVDDAELEWTYRPDTFDFIHVRNLAQATNDFPALVSQAYRCTAPGGYTELAEMGTAAYTEDGCNLADFSGLQRFVDLLHRSMERLGRPAHCTGEMLKEVLETAGFVNVVTSMYKEPSGPWPVEEKLKLAGAMTLLSGQTGFQAYGMAPFTRILGLSAKEAETVCQDAIRDIGNRNCRAYCNYYVVYGQKPRDGGV